MSFGHAQDYRKVGLFDDFLNAELDAEERKRMASTLPAPIDVAPLEQRLESQRRDFDSKLAGLRQIDPRTIEADLIGHQYAELVAMLDFEAKEFIDAAKKEFAPAIEKQRAALRAVQDILAHIIDGPEQIRALCKPISAAYQLAVRRKEEDDRRELERKQREAVEAERQAELERLRQQAAAERDERERARIEDEAKQVAAAPAIPVAVPTAAVAQPKPAGISGTEVFYHTITNWRQFCAALGGMPPTINAEGNSTEVTVAGISIKFSFTGLKKQRQPLAGMTVTKGIEVRNRRA